MNIIYGKYAKKKKFIISYAVLPVSCDNYGAERGDAAG